MSSCLSRRSLRAFLWGTSCGTLTLFVSSALLIILLCAGCIALAEELQILATTNSTTYASAGRGASDEALGALSRAPSAALRRAFAALAAPTGAWRPPASAIPLEGVREAWPGRSERSWRVSDGRWDVAHAALGGLPGPASLTRRLEGVKSPGNARDGSRWAIPDGNAAQVYAGTGRHALMAC